jgi:hypothetical protein
LVAIEIFVTDDDTIYSFAVTLPSETILPLESMFKLEPLTVNDPVIVGLCILILYNEPF